MEHTAFDVPELIKDEKEDGATKMINTKVRVVRKMLIVAEVSLIIGLFFYLLGVFRSLGFNDWQEPLFGKAILSLILLIFVLPLSTLILTRRNPGAYGLQAMRERAEICGGSVNLESDPGEGTTVVVTIPISS